MAATDNIPLHLRPAPHPPPDEDCDDMQKIVVTPVYRGRLEDAHERTRNNTWRRRPWYHVRYARWRRDANAFLQNHTQEIFAALTYITCAIMILVLMHGFISYALRYKRRRDLLQRLSSARPAETTNHQQQ